MIRTETMKTREGEICDDMREAERMGGGGSEMR